MAQTLPELRKEQSKFISEARYILRNNPLKILLNARKKSDEIVRLKFGRSDYYLIIDPDMVEQILISKQAYFGKEKYIGVFIPTMKAMQQRLIASTSAFETHDKQKKIEQPAFHQERITAYAKMMTDLAERYCSNWVDGEVVDIHREMVKLTTLIVAKCLFSIELESKAEEVGADLNTIASYYERLSNPFASLLVKLPTNRKYEVAVRRIDKLIADLIEERRNAKHDPGDLLSILLTAKNDAGMRMNNEQIRDQVGLFFVVGHETSANCLTWTYYLLSQNPTVEGKLHKEIDSLFPEYQTPEAKDVPKLDYTTKVIYESLRMYPPAWSIVRQTMKDCDLGGYPVPAGSNLWISQYLNHRDSRFFPEPEGFLPERWTDEMKKNLPKYAYFPFGGGSRRCIGEPFAWMEMALLIAMISRRWRMVHVEGHRVVPAPCISLPPRFGMKMTLHKR